MTIQLLFGFLFLFCFLVFLCIFSLYTASLTGVLGVKRFESIHMGQSRFSFKEGLSLDMDRHAEVLTDVWNIVLQL